MSQPKEEQLLFAALRSDLEKVKSRCGDPALNVNWQREGGYTPFYVASKAGHVGVVKYLLALKGIDPSKQQNQGATSFFAACSKGHKEMVSLMLADPRIDPNKPHNDGSTPILVACQNGHKEVVSLLLADPRIYPNKPLNDQGTPLWFASQNGHLPVVQRLFASERNIDTKIRSTFNNKTAAEQGRAMGARTTKENDETEEDFQRSKTNCPLCADLIDDYEREPEHLRVFRRLRRQPGQDLQPPSAPT